MQSGSLCLRGGSGGAIMSPPAVGSAYSDYGQLSYSRSVSGPLSVSDPITDFVDALRLGAMDTTEDVAVLFYAMTDNMDAAVGACRCDGVNGAFKAVERVCHPVHHYLKRLVIVVSAGFACRHGTLSVWWMG